MNFLSNIGVTELLVILLIALLVFGPERLPELAQQAGKLLRDLRKMYENLSREIGPELTSIQKTTAELRESLEAVRSIPQDLVKSVTQAADMDGTLKELKGVAGSVQQAGQALSAAQQAVQAPLQSVLSTAATPLPTQQPAATPPSTAADLATEPPAEAPPTDENERQGEAHD